MDQAWFDALPELPRGRKFIFQAIHVLLCAMPRPVAVKIGPGHRKLAPELWPLGEFVAKVLQGRDACEVEACHVEGFLAHLLCQAIVEGGVLEQDVATPGQQLLTLLVCGQAPKQRSARKPAWSPKPPPRPTPPLLLPPGQVQATAETEAPHRSEASVCTEPWAEPHAEDTAGPVAEAECWPEPEMAHNGTGEPSHTEEEVAEPAAETECPPEAKRQQDDPEAEPPNTGAVCQTKHTILGLICGSSDADEAAEPRKTKPQPAEATAPAAELEHRPEPEKPNDNATQQAAEAAKPVAEPACPPDSEGRQDDTREPPQEVAESVYHLVLVSFGGPNHADEAAEPRETEKAIEATEPSEPESLPRACETGKQRRRRRRRERLRQTA